jgi:hypothetical protein
MKKDFKSRDSMDRVFGLPGNRHVVIHEAGHALAAYAVGFGVRKRGVVLHGVEGITYSRAPGLRSRDPKKHEFYNRGNVVAAFAGPVAEYRVNQGLVHIDDDVQSIAWSVRELFPSKKQFLPKFIGGASNHDEKWGEFWALIYVLATCTERDTVLQELDDFPGLAKINAAIFEMLWPLAQEAHAVIDSRWSCVKKLSRSFRRFSSG